MDLENILDYELFGKVRVIVVLVFTGILALSIFDVVLIIRSFRKINKEEDNSQ